MKTKRCPKCERELPISQYQKDRDRADGLFRMCKDCAWAYKHSKWDRQQARYHVGKLVRHGIIPHPRTLRCVRCGGEASMYHHYLGHAREHWEHVLPVCRPCNMGRAYEQRALELGV